MKNFLTLLLAVAISPFLLAAKADPKPPGDGEFILTAPAKDAVYWNRYIDIQLGGNVDDAWFDETKWELRLNGVPVTIGRVYAGPESGQLRLAIMRPAEKPGGPGKLDGLSVRAITDNFLRDRDTPITLRFDGKSLKFAGDKKAFIHFGLIDPVRMTVFFAILALVIIGVWFIGWRTGVLRDSDARLDPIERPFSLARVQLALWTVLIGTSFVMIYLLTGQALDVLNGTAVALLGISGATTLASVAARDQKTNPASTNASTWALPTVTSQSKAVRHVGLVQDIISDANGANLHRVQMVMWTLVLAAIYVFDTFASLQLPTFDPQTFALMGISSTTYVWLKQRE